MGVFNKIKLILGILVVFVLIVATNLIDRSNFLKVKNSVVTLYEDRLIADELIFEMSSLYHEKEIAALKANSNYFEKHSKTNNEKLRLLIEKFEKTKLTEKEEIVFLNLKANNEAIQTAENDLVKSNFSEINPFVSLSSKIKRNLFELSKIQSDEGGRQRSISKSAIESIELFTQMEIYLLAVLAIIVQIIILYNPKMKVDEED